MSEKVSKSLKKIAKSTGVVLVGTFTGMILSFVGRVVVVRTLTKSEYGLYSLAVVLSSIVIQISALGLFQGSTRYIALYQGKKDSAKRRIVAVTSLKIVVITGLIGSLSLFLFSGFISTKIFHVPELSTPLKIISLTIPFTLIIHILASIFRGFGDVKPKVVFQDILRTIIFLSLLFGVFLIGPSLNGILYIYLASFFIASVVFTIYAAKRLGVDYFFKREVIDEPLGKNLLLFSLPLLFTSILGMVLNWADTLMLGYFKTPDLVGLYNGALTLARLIPLFLSSVGVMYVPVVSGLYSQKLMVEMKKTYQVLTKWIFLLTLPFFFITFLFPGTVLNFFFGPSYVVAATTLRILVLGFMIHVFFGLNGISLMVIGETRFLMITSFVGVAFNILLNVALIPAFGLEGAAIASLFSYGVVNVLVSLNLYRVSRIQPFSINYLKPITIATTLLILFNLTSFYIKVDFALLILLLFLFLIAYLFLLLFSKSFDEEDIKIILAIEKKLGIDAKPLKKILRRFL